MRIISMFEGGRQFFRGVKFLLFLLNLFFFSVKLSASSVVVGAKTDTAQIRIGEQFHLNFTANSLKGVKVMFPIVPDTFNHFEIVSKGKIDTLSDKNNTNLTLQQQLTLTSFDSGFYVIPPFPFVINESGITDTMLTEAMLVSVITVPVDTTKEIKAIKGIIDVPFPWLDYLLYLVIGIILIAIAWYVIRNLKKKKPIIPVRAVPQKPPHEIALEGLRRIEEEKLWQQGFTKKYFSEVTDVLRQYIERRFSFSAMEQTTDEILSYFSGDVIREDEKEKLKFILRHADMVKFAKALSLPVENETTMQFAYAFVNNTRPVVKEDFVKEEMV